MSDTLWDSSQPLRADARDEQIDERYDFIYDEEPRRVGADYTSAFVAREFASACVAAERERQTTSHITITQLIPDVRLTP